MGKSNSDSIVGYVIMENDNTFKEITNLDVVNDGTLCYVKFDTILQSLDCDNRNRRNYSGDAMVKSLSHPNIAELISKKKWKGEAGHPIDGSTKRIATVDPKCTSHYITKWWRDKDLIRGSIETIDDHMYGTKLCRSILQGETASFSYRGFAEMVKKGKTSYVLTPPTTITYDEVQLPSHPEAYAEPQTTLVAQSFTGQTKTYVREGVDYSRPITTNDLMDMVRQKSDVLQIVCESFDIDPKSIIKVDPYKVSLRKGSDTYVYMLESTLSREIAGYMGRL